MKPICHVISGSMNALNGLTVSNILYSTLYHSVMYLAKNKMKFAITPCIDTTINNVSKDVILTLNGLNEYDYIYPNEQILIPMEGVEIYVTRDNDTLNNILNTIGITANELVKQNDKLFLLPDQLVVYKKEKSF